MVKMSSTSPETSFLTSLAVRYGPREVDDDRGPSHGGGRDVSSGANAWTRRRGEYGEEGSSHGGVGVQEGGKWRGATSAVWGSGRPRGVGATSGDGDSGRHSARSKRMIQEDSTGNTARDSSFSAYVQRLTEKMSGEAINGGYGASHLAKHRATAPFDAHDSTGAPGMTHLSSSDSPSVRDAFASIEERREQVDRLVYGDKICREPIETVLSRAPAKGPVMVSCNPAHASQPAPMYESMETTVLKRSSDIGGFRQRAVGQVMSSSLSALQAKYGVTAKSDKRERAESVAATTRQSNGQSGRTSARWSGHEHDTTLVTDMTHTRREEMKQRGAHGPQAHSELVASDTTGRAAQGIYQVPSSGAGTKYEPLEVASLPKWAKVGSGTVSSKKKNSFAERSRQQLQRERDKKAVALARGGSAQPSVRNRATRQSSSTQRASTAGTMRRQSSAGRLESSAQMRKPNSAEATGQRARQRSALSSSASKVGPSSTGRRSASGQHRRAVEGKGSAKGVRSSSILSSSAGIVKGRVKAVASQSAANGMARNSSDVGRRGSEERGVKSATKPMSRPSSAAIEENPLYRGSYRSRVAHVPSTFDINATPQTSSDDVIVLSTVPEKSNLLTVPDRTDMSSDAEGSSEDEREYDDDEYDDSTSSSNSSGSHRMSVGEVSETRVRQRTSSVRFANDRLFLGEADKESETLNATIEDGISSACEGKGDVNEGKCAMVTRQTRSATGFLRSRTLNVTIGEQETEVGFESVDESLVTDIIAEDEEPDMDVDAEFENAITEWDRIKAAKRLEHDRVGDSQRVPSAASITEQLGDPAGSGHDEQNGVTQADAAHVADATPVEPRLMYNGCEVPLPKYDRERERKLAPVVGVEYMRSGVWYRSVIQCNVVWSGNADVRECNLFDVGAREIVQTGARILSRVFGRVWDRSPKYINVKHLADSPLVWPIFKMLFEIQCNNLMMRKDASYDCFRSFVSPYAFDVNCMHVKRYCSIQAAMIAQRMAVTHVIRFRQKNSQAQFVWSKKMRHMNVATFVLLYLIDPMLWRALCCDVVPQGMFVTNSCLTAWYEDAASFDADGEVQRRHAHANRSGRTGASLWELARGMFIPRQPWSKALRLSIDVRTRCVLRAVCAAIRGTVLNSQSSSGDGDRPSTAPLVEGADLYGGAPVPARLGMSRRDSQLELTDVDYLRPGALAWD